MKKSADSALFIHDTRPLLRGAVLSSPCSPSRGPLPREPPSPDQHWREGAGGRGRGTSEGGGRGGGTRERGEEGQVRGEGPRKPFSPQMTQRLDY